MAWWHGRLLAVVPPMTALAPHIVDDGASDRNTRNPSSMQNDMVRWIVVVTVADAAAATVVSCLVVVEMVGSLMVIILLVVVCVAAPNVLCCRRRCGGSAKKRTKYGPFCAHDGAQSRKTEKRNTTKTAMAMTTMAVVANRLFL